MTPTDEDMRLVHELHRLVIRELVSRMKSTPSAELLGVARAALRDNGVLGLAQDDKDRKRLQDLYALFVRRLHEAVNAPDPSAAVLSEARNFLQQQGVTKDLGAAIGQSNALRVLSSADLPFKLQ